MKDFSRPAWWQIKTISVYPSSPPNLTHIELGRDTDLGFVSEFDLNFKVESRDYSAFFGNITKDLPSDKKLDFYRFWEQIEAERKRDRFNEGLVILIDDSEVTEFTDSDPELLVLDEENERGQLPPPGISEHEKGFTLFGQFHYKLPEATRHECGYLFGLGHHCRSGDAHCCANYECPTEVYCDSCRRKSIEFLK
jgi:hypothetical protein